MGTAAESHQRYYRLLAVGRRSLGMSEEEYRAFLAGQGAGERDGRVSATTMSEGQLRRAVDAMRALGFRPKAPVPRPASDWRAPRIALIRKLWRALGKAGVLRSPGDAALERFAARLTGTARLEWADGAGLNDVVEALKAWCARERVRVDG